MVEINKCGLLEIDEKKKIKICFAASSGGHYEQLMMLKPLMKKYDSFVITEKTDYSAESKGEKTYYMKQVNRREKDFIWRMIQNAWKSISIYRKEKPDVVICTGVLAMIPICLISKLMGKKLIYIESFAKVTSPTETGKLLYKFADRFYVQWKPMLKFYPNPPLIEKPVNQKPSQHQMEHYQKFYENGEYVRAVESTTEQNYNMIDGCANNLPKPRIINGRESVLDKLRIRQMTREKQKSGQMQEQSTDIERNRK